jgi:hypothetical protein
MAGEFDAAKNGFAAYCGYFGTAARELGLERALALNTKSQESMGVAQGKAIKEQSGRQEFDLQAVKSLVKEPTEQGIGLRSEVIEETQNSVVFRLGRCPFYDAALSVGLSGDTIEKICRSGSMRFMDSTVKQMNPRLSYELLRMRSSQDDFCEEAIRLAD